MSHLVPGGDLTPFALAVPGVHKRSDPVAAYRAYYRADKAAIATWRRPASPPEWWT